MNERRTIDVDDLVVDEENPRFEAVSTEDDALYSILADQKLGTGNKILNLARDIAAHGLNASELLVVSPIEGTRTYLVREGNRRVTAIKLSLNGERIPEDFRKLAPQFAELAAAMQAHRRIECCVCDDEQEIRRLLLLRHGGENNGIGTVKWNSTQTTRFNEEGNPQTARALSFVGHLQNDYGQGDLWTTAAVIPPTNLGRLITTPEVRHMLNIDVDGNDACYRGGHDELLLGVLLTLKEKGVGAIYDKGTRVRLVEEAAEHIEPDGPRQAHLPFDTSDADAGEGDQVAWDGHDTGSDGERARTDAGANEPDEPTLSDFSGTTQAQGNAEASGQQQTSAAPDESLAGEEQADATRASGSVRRKPVSHNDGKRMFGCKLKPKGARSNDLYRAIEWIDQLYLTDTNNNAHLLPILGFSLRLMVETVAREYYQAQGKDPGVNAFNSFVKDVAKPAIKKKLDASGRADMALASEWINEDIPFEGLLHNWAHGVLPVDRSSLVRQSELVALIVNEVWA